MNEQYNLETAKKQKVRLPLSAYLSYLLIAALLLTGVSFSKFASSGSADDGAKVAVVVVEADTNSGLEFKDIDIMNGITESACEFYVTNGASEVAQEYTITIILPDELPDGLTMKLLDSQGSECTLEQSENTYTYTDSFAAGAKEQHDYALTFTGNEETLTGDYVIEGIQISVTAEQID